MAVVKDRDPVVSSTPAAAVEKDVSPAPITAGTENDASTSGIESPDVIVLTPESGVNRVKPSPVTMAMKEEKNLAMVREVSEFVEEEPNVYEEETD